MIGMDTGVVGVSVDVGLAIKAMVPAGSGGVAMSPLSFLVVAGLTSSSGGATVAEW